MNALISQSRHLIVATEEDISLLHDLPQSLRSYKKKMYVNQWEELTTEMIDKGM